VAKSPSDFITPPQELKKLTVTVDQKQEIDGK